METFLSSLSNELFKLRRRKKYLVFLILGCAICVISALRVLLVNYLTDGSVDPAAVLGGLRARIPSVLTPARRSLPGPAPLSRPAPPPGPGASDNGEGPHVQRGGF